MAWLPEPVSELRSAFVRDGHRFALVGAAARAVALGDDPSGTRRLDFVTDAPRDTWPARAGAIRSLVGGNERGRGRLVLRCGEAEGALTIRVAAFRSFPRLRERLGRPMDDPLLRDLASREITIHTIAVDDGTVLDPFGGVADFRARRIRAVLPARQLHRESARWILRMARHASYYGFEVDPDLVRAARGCVGALLDVAPERCRDELERALLLRHPDAGLGFLQRCGALALLLPEVEALVGFAGTCPVHHKDIWAHTCLVVRRSLAEPAQRWTALLHDVGKVATRSVSEQGTVHFFRHEDQSARLFVGIRARLRFDAPLAEKVMFLITNHSRVNHYDGEWTDSAVRRLIRETGEHLDDLLAFSKADVTSRREDRVAQLRRLMAELEDRIERVREEDARPKPLPAGVGNVIMERFGLPPSRVIGVLRERLVEAVEDGSLPHGLSAEEYVEHLAAWLDAERQGP